MLKRMSFEFFDEPTIMDVFLIDRNVRILIDLCASSLVLGCIGVACNHLYWFKLSWERTISIFYVRDFSSLIEQNDCIFT